MQKFKNLRKRIKWLPILSLFCGIFSSLFSCFGCAVTCSNGDSYIMTVSSMTLKTPYFRSIGSFSCSDSELDSFSSFRKSVFEFTYGFSNSFFGTQFSNISVSFLNKVVDPKSCDYALDYLNYQFSGRNDALLYLSTGSFPAEDDTSGILVSEAFGSFLLTLGGYSSKDYSQLLSLKDPIEFSAGSEKVSAHISGVFPSSSAGLPTLSVINSCLSDHFGNFIVLPAPLLASLKLGCNSYLSFSENAAKNENAFSLANSYYRSFEKRLSFEATPDNAIRSDMRYQNMSEVPSGLISAKQNGWAITATVLFLLSSLANFVFIIGYLSYCFHFAFDNERLVVNYGSPLYYIGLFAGVFALRKITGGSIAFQNCLFPTFNHWSLGLLALSCFLFLGIYCLLHFLIYPKAGTKLQPVSSKEVATSYYQL
jgi:hypothetical protein